MSRSVSARLDESFVALFREAPGAPLPWTAIATALSLSLEDVQAVVARLELAGYAFDVSPDRGVAIRERPRFLVHTEVFPCLDTRWLGRVIRFYRTVESTNDLLLAAAPDDAEGLVVFAEEQTRGRGRQGRRWEAPAGRALQFSILIRPTRGVWEASDATLAAAAGMVDGLREATGVTALVRWPNDLSVDGRKLCGILSEYRTAAGNFVIGIGLNVNQTEEETPEGGTSLRVLTGRETARGPL
ncbi:MAG: biotin--[acetyl-CoA-carboxylase] ligase, partial [Gemmatimonadetes bacterium]|nr:biotin--[acetyl-CoA-carboxylase] ligase [Gemmatimonadota bacterium]